MNNNKKVYELIQSQPKLLEIKSYAIRYANCDYIHAENIRNGIRRIFERKKLDKFKEVNQYDCLENEIVFGFTLDEKIAEKQLEKLRVIYEIQRLENEVDNLNITKNYYNNKIKDNKSQLAYLDLQLNNMTSDFVAVNFENRYD